MLTFESLSVIASILTPQTTTTTTAIVQQLANLKTGRKSPRLAIASYIQPQPSQCYSNPQRSILVYKKPASSTIALATTAVQPFSFEVQSSISLFFCHGFKIVSLLLSLFLFFPFFFLFSLSLSSYSQLGSSSKVFFFSLSSSPYSCFLLPSLFSSLAHSLLFSTSISF